MTKAAERLRRGDYYCRRLGVHLSWVADLGGWWDETDFHETRDTGFLPARLDEIEDCRGSQIRRVRNGQSFNDVPK